MEAVEYHYLGALPDISDLLLAVDMVVVPSLVEEAFPNVALEAMALSICIVAYKSGGLKEIVIDGKTGMLIDKGDTASLGAAIQKLIDEPDIRAAMGQQGRQRAVELYHYDNFKRLVNAMISQQGGRGPV
jgi:glycosyltransferase involved in cell wall biosynthesis